MKFAISKKTFMSGEKILITGAFGQIGTVLTQELIKIYGYDNVLATDYIEDKLHNSLYEQLDILDLDRFEYIIDKYKITQIYHMAALLSAKGESNPQLTWDVNLNAYLAILELARKKEIKRIFFPSSIAVFGATTPQYETPQDCPLVPTTVYGISKVAGELWSNYYFEKYRLDVRSIRYPGIIGYQSLPGGGTTDYAVDIFHQAITKGQYECFLAENTMLPMMYMEDAIRATIELMMAPIERIRIRYGYNLAEMSFTPAQIFEEIKKHIPGLTIEYNPDFRQAIADSWTKSIDDSRAKLDWGWKANYSLETMVVDMLVHLKEKYGDKSIY
jgi:nucleoside-diphosphate-sugar epimerase